MSKSDAKRIAVQKGAVASPLEEEQFIRIKKLSPKPGDWYESFQPEIITVIGDKVVTRKFISKPDLFEFAYAVAAEHIDPRNK